MTRTLALLFLSSALALPGADYKPADGPLMTRWAKQVSPDNALPEYPRPQLRRNEWLNLNGMWQYAIVDRDAAQPSSWQGEILVPFVPQAALSGIGKPVSPDQALWYRRTFEVPANWNGSRIRLNFGAVDWQATVWLNGVKLGEHRGGYTPFSFELSDALAAGSEQEIVVRVWDPTDIGTQPRGKQVNEPQGIWYTAVTGIWQTVWAEPVGPVSIERLWLEPDIDNNRLIVKAALRGNPAGVSLHARALDDAQQVSQSFGPAGEALELRIPTPKLWSPDSPHLYGLELSLTRGNQTLDSADSYFAMRKIALERDARGYQMLALNNEILFQMGPLDQGWWPDGLYTAPTEEALIYDIEVTKDLGFNMARKHVKVEPDRWYYHCDRLGLLVWQDMPSGFLGRGHERSLFVFPWDEDAKRTGNAQAQFEGELREMIDHLQQFPSIVMWVPFNEGWGQYDTARIAKWIRQYDPTRLVNAASGWTDRGVGDVYDTHIYPGPGMQYGGKDRAAVLGEFGGLGWPVDDHLWWNKRNWGYRTYHSRDELATQYEKVVGEVVGPISRGLAAAIYTQTTDVEGEVNGLMTYDREMVKFNAAKLRAIHDKLYAKPRPSRVLLPAGHDKPQPWRYTFKAPGKGWEQARFNDRRWSEGEAPFREKPDVEFVNGTEWKGPSIWMRRTFTIDQMPKSLWLEIQHTVTDGEVYINGQKVDTLDRFSRREYRHTDISEHLGALKQGENVIAVHAAVGANPRDDPKNVDAGLYAIE
ncbi:MAG: beta-galactosidase [Acidobacteria bacterium]|nr:beta-galactosidase [Acidobacteriota bacterium]